MASHALGKSSDIDRRKARQIRLEDDVYTLLADKAAKGGYIQATGGYHDHVKLGIEALIKDFALSPSAADVNKNFNQDGE